MTKGKNINILNIHLHRLHRIIPENINHLNRYLAPSFGAFVGYAF